MTRFTPSILPPSLPSFFLSLLPHKRPPAREGQRRAIQPLCPRRCVAGCHRMQLSAGTGRPFRTETESLRVGLGVSGSDMLRTGLGTPARAAPPRRRPTLASEKEPPVLALIEWMVGSTRCRSAAMAGQLSAGHRRTALGSVGYPARGPILCHFMPFYSILQRFELVRGAIVGRAAPESTWSPSPRPLSPRLPPRSGGQYALTSIPKCTKLGEILPVTTLTFLSPFLSLPFSLSLSLSLPLSLSLSLSVCICLSVCLCLSVSQPG